MIEGNNNERQKEQLSPAPGPDKGKPSRLLVVLAAADYLGYWILVFYFPRIMIAVSFLLVFFVLYLMRKPGQVAECLENLELTPPRAEWIRRWLSSWVVTVVLGCAFSLALIF